MYQASIRGKKKHQKFHHVKVDNFNVDNENTEYAYVKKLLGNCNVSLITNSGIEAIGIIRGSLRKFNTRIVIEVGDIVVVSKREYQSDKVDIIHKYNPDQVQCLINEEKLSHIILHIYNNVNVISNKKSIEYENDSYIDFGYVSSDSN